MSKQYRDQPVVFVGLTSDDGGALSEIDRYLEAAQTTWVSGYGAGPTLAALKANVIPLTWVVDANGRIVWNSDSREPIETAIDAALETLATLSEAG